MPFVEVNALRRGTSSVNSTLATGSIPVLDTQCSNQGVKMIKRNVSLIAAAAMLAALSIVAPAKADTSCTASGGRNCTICTYWEDGTVHCYAVQK